MKDYYKILGLHSEADGDEIRRAYRRKAKDVHPDVTAASNEFDFILLREAYDVLSSPEIRAEYDRVYNRLFQKKASFNYREFLQNHLNEIEFQVKLICYDLLHQAEDEALERYFALGKRPIYVFADHLDREDFMDFAYIIADELFLRRKYRKAFSIFYELALLEEDLSYFKHFYPELLARLREITRRKIRGAAADEQKVKWLEQLLELSYPINDIAQIHKQIAEILLSHGEGSLAREHLSLALSINPKLPGKSKLEARIAHGG